MLKRWIAGFGLCAALLGAQPGCAHQMTNSEFALGAVTVGLVVGAAVLSGTTTNCNLQSPCPTRDPAAVRSGIATGARGDAAAHETPGASVFDRP
jgi:hypothetical protein